VSKGVQLEHFRLLLFRSSYLQHIQKKSVEFLKANYATSEEAADKLPRALVNFYQQNYAKLYTERSQDGCVANMIFRWLRCRSETLERPQIKAIN
jgi:hypothetical protein